ncbi:NAD(P)/FAD-dependent oxidoreductase [Streptomyces verrucosisporus]|uniref:FAD-dependent oxidoreductase n=1 Tax=Streptomyces verrucosisporus TaxID=1695161 RepID=UPI001F126F6F|nr:FAD-dependent oxidoreductase [Streptomyces verrucosisporus]MBN3929562.1 NAD(P)/FAD-dependent oxidoreductase [Streptomyces verrucosisporus]
MRAGIVIVGHGPAAHRLVQLLRRYGYRGRIGVLGAEHRPAYQRSLLGEVLGGRLRPPALTLPAVAEGADVRDGVTVTGVDRRRALVHTDDGGSHPYDTLVLATGARPHLPDLPGLRAPDGAPADGVTALRTLDDCLRIASAPGTGPTGAGKGGTQGPGVVVLGAGVLGVETAVDLRGAGHDVTLVHPAPHPMENRLDAPAGLLLTERLERLGVRMLPGRTPLAYRSGTLLLEDGGQVPARHLVVCAGAVPETSLARGCGLAVRTGVVVDAELRTSDPRVRAIGDCAEYQGTAGGSVLTAWEQADVLARLLTGGRARFRGARSAVRLRARGIDLAVLGGPDAPGEGHCADEVVTLMDRTRGRYARLVLREGRVHGAVLLGLPRAIAAVAQLYDQDLPAPSDRLSLLLGTPPADDRGGPAEDDVVCFCGGVTRAEVRRSWRDGARDLAAVAAATRATTGCGGCARDVLALGGGARSGAVEPVDGGPRRLAGLLGEGGA